MKKIVLILLIAVAVLSSCNESNSVGNNPAVLLKTGSTPEIHRTEGNVYIYKGEPRPLSEKVIENKVNILGKELTNDKLLDKYIRMLSYKNGEKAEIIPCDSHDFTESAGIGVGCSFCSLNGWHIKAFRPQSVCSKCGYPCWGELIYCVEPHNFRVWKYSGKESHKNNIHTFEFESNCAACMQYAVKNEQVECVGESHAYVGEDGMIYN